jgi:hypothetical protein
MPRKEKPKPDDPAQSKRFIETAKDVGADDDGDALERAFSKIIKSPNRPARHKMTKTTDSQKSQ